MGDEDIVTKLGKGNLSCSIVNAIRDKYLKGLKRLNKDKKHIIATLLRTRIIGLKNYLY
jgi:hypothetical protein